jgi:hypothetical protein
MAKDEKDEKIEIGQDHQGKGNAKAGGLQKSGKSTNHEEHDEHLHKLMPNGYKGDCGY